METLMNWLTKLDSWVWSDWVLISALVTGVVFTIFSGFSQYRSLTHGSKAVFGKYSAEGGAGSISHFQALSAALSATVGLGNIAGVAMAVLLGGPGAIFWMWIVGFFGMAIKFTEVTLSMLYRNTDDPENPSGGPMWVLKSVSEEVMPGKLGKFIGGLLGGIFCVALIIAALTGGNLFQAYNVSDIAVNVASDFGLADKTTTVWVVGITLALLVGAVIIGGIKRIGAVAGTIVPFMCGIYVVCGLVIIFWNIADVPAVFALIVDSALNGQTATNAFIGGTVGAAFTFGMQRALFSSEAGFGSAPIAHCAVKTKEPVREGVVAGLEPFIDTLVVCTITALVVLLSGVWNRAPDYPDLVDAAQPQSIPAQVTLAQTVFSDEDEYPELTVGTQVYAQVLATPVKAEEAKNYWLTGSVQNSPAGRVLAWDALPMSELDADESISLQDEALYSSRAADAQFGEHPELSLLKNDDAKWVLPNRYLSAAESTTLSADQGVFWVVHDGAELDERGHDRWFGKVLVGEQQHVIVWDQFAFEDGSIAPQFNPGLYKKLVGASVTRVAFEQELPGVGGWMVSIAVILFALSTMIAWSYYGEQGIIFLTGGRNTQATQVILLVYKLIFCAVIVFSCVGLDPDNKELNTISNIGVGLMLTMNIPIILLFGMTAIRKYHGYIQRLKAGEFDRT